MSSLPDLVTTSARALLSGHLPPSDVLKLLISKMLGLGVMAGASITKIPQIRNILSSQSAEGLSPLSFELETAGLAIHSAYGYLTAMPFNAYGETVILVAQNVVILALIYKYAKLPATRAALVISLFVGLLGIVFSGNVTREQIELAFYCNNFILLGARVPQIVKNYRAHCTGQLSIITFVMNVAGCIVRLYTSAQEGGGVAMIRGYLLSLSLNLTLALQIIAYSKDTAAPVAQAAAVKKSQ